MKKFKSVVSLGMAVLTMGTTTACTEREVLTAALIVGAAVVAPTDHRPIGRGHHHRDNIDRRQDRINDRQDRINDRQDRINDRQDRRGNNPRLEQREDRLENREDRLERREDRLERIEDRQDRRPRRPRRLNTFALVQTASAPAAFKSSDARVIKIADKYEISDYAATYIARAIILAKQKDLTGVAELGLSKKDFAKVYQGKELETAKLEAVSQKLILSRGETQRLLKEMTEDIQVEKAARGL